MAEVGGVTTAGPADEVDPEFLDEAGLFLAASATEMKFTEVEIRDRVGLFPDLTPDEEAEELRRARRWRSRRFDAGFGWITGPARYGGRDLSATYERAYLRLERRYTFPQQRLYDIGLGMVAPTLLAFGRDEIKERYLRSMYRGDIVGCQLFSEPGAGSDLAGVSTRSVRDGSTWRINGQKVWSSGAHLSQLGLLVCRSGDERARHRNLTAFLLPMDSEGVTVRPLKQMTGGASFNEVFLEEVRLHDDFRLGDIDNGWEVVVATLMNERAAVGAPAAGGSGILSTQRMTSLLDRFGNHDDPCVRDELMRLHCALAVARMTRLRTEAKLHAGQRPGPEMSVGKLALTQNLQAMTHLLGRVLGPRLVADTCEPEAYIWAEFVLGVPGLRIGGGTDEIQRNILAERVLGLPRDRS